MSDRKMRELTVNQMVQMQSDLNSLINPNWMNERTKDDFMMQIIDEMSELLGSNVHYKWWKKAPEGEVDIHNIKIEIIDIIHFALSIAAIVEHRNPCESYIEFDEFQPPTLLNGNKVDSNVFVNIFRTCDVIEPYMPGANNIEFHVQDILEYICSIIDITSEELSAVYTAKYVLNQIRQNNGYKDGTYVKVDDGVEDNVKLKKAIDSFLEDKSKDLETLKSEVVDIFYVKV